MLDKFFASSKAHFNRWQGFSAKGFCRNALIESFDEHLVLIQINKVLRGIGETEFLFQNFSIRIANTKRNERRHITEHRLACRKGELFDVLMGER